jgi:hypothetical protein
MKKAAAPVARVSRYTWSFFEYKVSQQSSQKTVGMEEFFRLPSSPADVELSQFASTS